MSRKFYLWCAGICLVVPTCPATITYEFLPTIGRFGDQLITWLKADWTAHVTQQPLLYQPFLYSDRLNLHQNTAIAYNNACMQRVDNLDKITRFPNTCYVLNYGFTTRDWHPLVTNEEWQHFDDMFYSMKRDPIFYQKAKHLMKPAKEVPLIHPPKRSVSIAVHVRTGGEWEPDKTWPYHRYLRFLPLEWYAQQINYITKQWRSKRIYISIFTDDSHPEKIIETFKKIIKNPRITWNFRASGNAHDANVIEDMWSMAQFDCLIRPWSQLSRLAEFLGNHKLVIFPVKHEEHDDKHIITFELRRHQRRLRRDHITIAQDVTTKPSGIS